jgi:Rv0078B-related antitoxin
MPPPLDTTPEIEAMQIRIFRSMTIEQHLESALEITLLSRALMRAGVRRDHPDWSDRQIEREVHRLAFFPQPLPDWVR